MVVFLVIKYWGQCSVYHSFKLCDVSFWIVKADKFKFLQKPGGIIALLDEAWLACFPLLIHTSVILILLNSR